MPRAAGDREPRLGANGERRRVELRPPLAELHPADLDPLVRRARAGERREFALRLVDGAERVAPAPDLHRVQVETDHVRAGDEAGVDAAPVRRSGRAAVDVAAGRQERHAVRLLPRRMERQRFRPHVQVGLVGVVPADRAAAVGDVLPGRGDRGDRAGAQRVELHPRRAAAAAHVEVHAGVEALLVRPVALAVDHAWEERLAVDVQRPIDTAPTVHSGNGRVVNVPTVRTIAGPRRAVTRRRYVVLGSSEPSSARPSARGCFGVRSQMPNTSFRRPRPS